MSLRTYPARLATGLFLINSGLGKRHLPEEAARGLRDMGAVGVPQLASIDPTTFGRGLSAGEIALGAALVVPVVPDWLVGAGLGAFSAGLLSMYHRTPGMTIDGIRPTQEGTGVAKDVFMLGIAGSLIAESVGR